MPVKKTFLLVTVIWMNYSPKCLSWFLPLQCYFLSCRKYFVLLLPVYFDLLIIRLDRTSEFTIFRLLDKFMIFAELFYFSLTLNEHNLVFLWFLTSEFRFQHIFVFSWDPLNQNLSMRTGQWMYAGDTPRFLTNFLAPVISKNFPVQPKKTKTCFFLVSDVWVFF